MPDIRAGVRFHLAQLGVVNVLIAGLTCDRASSAIEEIVDGRGGMAIAYGAMAIAGACLLYVRLHRNLLRAQLVCARAADYTPTGATCASMLEGMFDGRRHWCKLPAHLGDVHQCRCGVSWGTDCLG